MTNICCTEMTVNTTNMSQGERACTSPFCGQHLPQENSPRVFLCLLRSWRMEPWAKKLLLVPSGRWLHISQLPDLVYQSSCLSEVHNNEHKISHKFSCLLLYGKFQVPDTELYVCYWEHVASTRTCKQGAATEWWGSHRPKETSTNIYQEFISWLNLYTRSCRDDNATDQDF